MLSSRRTRSYIFFYIRIVFYAATNRQDEFDGDFNTNKDLRADSVAPNYGKEVQSAKGNGSGSGET